MTPRERKELRATAMHALAHHREKHRPNCDDRVCLDAASIITLLDETRIVVDDEGVRHVEIPGMRLVQHGRTGFKVESTRIPIGIRCTVEWDGNRWRWVVRHEDDTQSVSSREPTLADAVEALWVRVER